MRLTNGSRSGQPRADPEPAWQNAVAAVVAVTAALALVFALDEGTGSAPVQHLYYLPIILAGIRFGMRGGLVTPCIAIVLYHLANPRLLAFEHEHWDVVQVALFLAVGVITAQLTDDKRRLHRLATTDDLTGLHNLRSFEQRLALMVRSCRQSGVPLTMLVLDVDRLKAMNDVHGHLAGAEAVRTIGHIVGERLPPPAVACRYGGDEFVVAAAGWAEAEAAAVADEIRDAVRTIAPVLAGTEFPAGTLSVSVGVACHAFDSPDVGPGDVEIGEELFRAADRALYRAKALGRNHVCVARRHLAIDLFEPVD
jgi:diguanylate cyclase (GGDEF)-like protein